MSFCSHPKSWLEIKCCNSDSVEENILYRPSEVTQSCPALCDPMDCSLTGSSIHGIFQSRVLEWVAISFSRWSYQPRDQTQVSHIAGRRFTVWATWEAPYQEMCTKRNNLEISSFTQDLEFEFYLSQTNDKYLHRIFDNLSIPFFILF